MSSDRQRNRADRAAKAAAGAGFEFAASVGAFTVLGFFVDRWLGTSPRWLLIGAAIGFVGGGWNLYKTAHGLMRATTPRSTSKTMNAGSDDAPSATGKGNGHHDSGVSNAHVALPEDRKRKARNDFGMFGRAEVEEADMAGEDEVRWPADAGADDTLRVDDEEGGRDDGRG